MIAYGDVFCGVELNHIDDLLAVADWLVFGGSTTEDDREIISTSKSGVSRAVTNVRNGQFGSVSRDCPGASVQAGSAI